MISEVLIMHHVWIALYILPSGWLGCGAGCRLHCRPSLPNARLLPAASVSLSAAAKEDLGLGLLQGSGGVPSLVTAPLLPTCISLLPQSPQHRPLRSQNPPQVPVLCRGAAALGDLGGWLGWRYVFLPPPALLCVGVQASCRSSRGVCGPEGGTLPWWSAQSH